MRSKLVPRVLAAGSDCLFAAVSRGAVDQHRRVSPARGCAAVRTGSPGPAPTASTPLRRSAVAGSVAKVATAAVTPIAKVVRTGRRMAVLLGDGWLRSA